MKVLWLTCTPAGASKIVKQSPHARGWIASLGDLIKEDSSINLAVAFFDNFRNDFKFDHDGIVYYPMKDKLSTRIGQLKSRSIGKLWDTNLPGVLKAIEDFKPDIIQIFGTESGMVDIIEKTKIPIIIHLQGLINPYLLQWLPKGISFRSIFFKSSPRQLLMRRDLVSQYFLFKKMADREERAIKNTKYFFGRTGWDRRFVTLLNPEVEYFHCEEVLRPVIYEYTGKWQYQEKEVIRLVTAINPQTYKGLEIVLHTAQILKSKTSLNFEWNIIGVAKDNKIVKVMEANNTLRFRNYPVNFLGVKQGEELIIELLKSSLFIHPSHIDNSPNSVCEAMLLGMPVIAGFVGGISSLIDDNINGLLYNSYDPYDLAGLIMQCHEDPKRMERIGKTAATTATKRHDRLTIVETIKSAYKVMLS